MGRSRGVSNSTDEDSNQRSKRRRVASSGENSEALATGPGTSEGKKALYHCNYCNKDISGKIRIKCTKCPDFDLCVECFSVGAEVTPHKSNHPYRVMDNLSFPLIFPDWNADEEILLLEGIEMYGLGNWAEVAEHVGTKSKAQCIDHYTTAYMNSPCYPLPDMSRVNGKNRKELLAMAKVQGEGKKGLRQKLRCTACFSEQPVTSSCFEEFSMCNTGKAGISMLGDVMPKEESPFSPSRVKIEDLSEALAGRSPSGLNSVLSSVGASKKASNVGQFKDGSDGIKVEGLTSTKDLHMDRSVGVKKPKYSGDEGPSMKALSGFNVKRQEFDPEYDNFAEKPLADMEFKETDSETDRELKLRVLRIYLSRLDERKRRKEFILERKLLYPNPLENELSSEDREAYQRFKVFMRFLSQEEYGTLMKTVIEERKIRRRIQELQECRAAGCRTLAEVKMYTEQKRKKELETSAQKLKEAGQIVASGKAVQKANRPMNREKGESDGSPRNSIDNHKLRGGTGLEPGGKDSPISQASTKSFDEWNITGLPGTELLSESEQQLCCQSRLLPSLYLKMQEVLVQEILKGSVGKKSDAHPLFNVDPSKVDKVYDIVTKKLGQHEEVANI